MTYYQVVITLYKYQWWSGKWKPKEVFYSPVIHKDYFEAQEWRPQFFSILIRRGWKLKEGNYGYCINELSYEPRPVYESPLIKRKENE